MVVTSRTPLEGAMKNRISRDLPHAKAVAEPVNPLWIITVLLAIFFAAAAAILALG